MLRTIIIFAIKYIPIVGKVIKLLIKLQKKYFPVFPARYFVLIIISVIISTILHILIYYYYIEPRNISDSPKNSAKIHNRKMEFEKIREKACAIFKYTPNNCPLKIRSFNFHYDTNKKQFINSGAWCYSHKDMITNIDQYFFETRAIHMDTKCKEYLKTHFLPDQKVVISKPTLMSICPAVATECVFKQFDKHLLKSAVLSCDDNKKYQGITCYAMVDGDNVDDYRLALTNHSIVEFIEENIVSDDVGFFGE